MIEATVAEMYRDDEANQFLEVTYQNGDKEVMYFKDFSSGAMIENIVRRAKKLAIKRLLADGTRGIRVDDLDRVDPPGVQGARGPAQHHQPRRLGQDLGQEGRAHRLRAHARQEARHRPRGRPGHRAGRHRPVPLTLDRHASGGPSRRPGEPFRTVGIGRLGPVAIHKICGIETEYGIVLRGAEDPNPIAASSVLINAYLHELARGSRSAGAAPKVGWDFEDEQPGNDARGFSPLGTMAPEVETHLVNAVLTNGARYYVDHAHPELLDARVRRRPVDRRVRPGRRAHPAGARWPPPPSSCPPGQEIVVYKNNSDGKGNSYGCHENYLMDRPGAVRADRRPRHPPLRHPPDLHRGGQGRLRGAGLGPDEVPFQLTQRADFFEEEVGLETTLKRPIVNTRDEPHADAQKYRRLHVIVGDANLSEVATFLKVGTTALVLAMIEDDCLPRDLAFAAPGAGPAPGVLRPHPDPRPRAGRRHHRHRPRGAVGAVRPGPQVRRRGRPRVRRRSRSAPRCCAGGRRCSTGLETDPCRLADQLDWVAKHRLIDGYRERHGLEWDDARLAALDLQYHDLRPETLARRPGRARALCRRRRGRARP